MKLIVVTSVHEYEKKVCELFKKSCIEIYSSAPIEGHKFLGIENLQDNWFSANRNTYDSIVYFSFTDEDKIDDMLNHIKDFNNKQNSNNPVKAIVLPIEKYV